MKLFPYHNMEGPSEINSVFWNEEKKSWDYKMIKVDEYFGFTECQQCRKPMSHNVKTDGEFKMVYVKCACANRK
ncbi:hypothetical protein [Nitrosopumilus cobalaminigenes]|nr:hypothetical protein [Nitrosopumilus cobalaminigenes]